jgi:hypothetical protein
MYAKVIDDEPDPRLLSAVRRIIDLMGPCYRLGLHSNDGEPVFNKDGERSPSVIDPQYFSWDSLTDGNAVIGASWDAGKGLYIMLESHGGITVHNNNTTFSHHAVGLEGTKFEDNSLDDNTDNPNTLIRHVKPDEDELVKEILYRLRLSWPN